MPLIALIGSFFAKFFADKVVGWVATKALLVFLFLTVVPLLLNNFLFDIIELMMTFASGQAAGASGFNGAMSFTGFCAWLVECFRISEAIAVLVSALCLRIVLSMIPFVRMV